MLAPAALFGGPLCVLVLMAVAHDRWGEVPVAALVRSPDAAGQALSEPAVLAHLQGQIARFKLPQRVLFVAELPKTATGKIQRFRLRDQEKA